MMVKARHSKEHIDQSLFSYLFKEYFLDFNGEEKQSEKAC
jgi:hypothetical protein